MTTSTIDQSFFVAGVPAAQPRVKAFKRGNHAGVYDPGTADGWKTLVAIAVRGLPPVWVETEVTMEFFFTRPKGHYRTGRSDLRPSAPTFHTQKPDIDNLAKSTLDAMVGAGFLADDALVVKLVASKRWNFWVGKPQGCQIQIRKAALE